MNSEYLARDALSRMNMSVVALAPHYTGLVADLRMMAQTNPEQGKAAFLARRSELCAAYGFAESDQRKPFAFAGGIAIIPVHGSLINRFGQSWGYVTGYNFIRQQKNLAILDDDVKAIFYDFNSYGGEAAGCFELTAEIYADRGKKPTLAVVDSNCYSAAYALASGADRIVVTPSGGAGSIGVVAMHVNMSKLLEDWGVDITLIHAGAHKVDGNPFEKLPDDVRADIQLSVEKSRTMFASLVAKNRGMDIKKVLETEARIYRADDALSIGLIDAVATPTEALQAFLGELSGSTSQRQKEDKMSTQDAGTKPEASADPAAIAKASAEAQKAERTRVSGILNCEEATGRTQLANHLALNTSMSVDEAKATLAAVPIVEPKAEAPKADANRFKQSMDGSTHPNVGADGAVGEGGDGESASARILRNQEAATGLKLVSK